MKTLKEQLNEATAHVAFSTDEKADMRARLVEYMEYKPVRTQATTAAPTRALPAFSFFKAHHLSGALLIALVVTTSTFGVSRAAGDALPGDLLYGVKVNINEEIKTAFLSSEEARLAWERERAEMRLTEAGQLAAAGQLDTKKQETVAELFAEHAEAVVEQVLAVELVNPVYAAEVSGEFEESLDTHEAVLARLIVEQDDESDVEARGLVEQVRSAAIEAGKIREDAEELLAVDEDEAVADEQVESDEELSEEEIQDKTDSANLRERAAYRAQERARELLAAAEELLSSMEPESNMAIQARMQLDSGNVRMEEGALALENNQFGSAYRAFRSAAISFQKVAQLLEAAELFSIEIHAEKEPLVGEEEPEGDELTLRTQDARIEAEERIAEAQTQLLTHEGYAPGDAAYANGLIKEAMSHVLRGDISLVLDDPHDALMLFESAEDLAAQALAFLIEAAEADGVTDVPAPEPGDGTPADVTPVDEPPVDEIPGKKAGMVLRNTFAEGTHSYSGTVTLPTPCTVLETGALIMESFPEQIVLTLTTAAPEGDVDCIQVIDERKFSIDVQASPEAELKDVEINGEVVEWELEQVPVVEVPEDVVPVVAPVE
jgi:hypothetical protein